MKIISPFRDYYDRALAFGYDDHVVYVRKPIELYNSYDNKLRFVKDFDHLFSQGGRRSTPGHDNSTIETSFVQILFCGKIYRGIRVTKKPHWTHSTSETVTGVYYDTDAVVQAVAKHGGDIDADFRRSARAWWRDDFFTHNSYRSWLNHQGGEQHQEFAITNKYVALVIDEGEQSHVTSNPKLSDYDFYRIIDPVTAYQEIEMYLSGVLASSGNEMVTTEDKYKIMAAGFDKQSFRKSPTKHR